MKVDNIKIEEVGPSEIEISGEISVATITPFKEKALATLAKNADIHGFRKGHVPEKIILERMGETAVLLEAAEEALQEIYPQIIEEKKLPVLGRPEVNLTKLAPGNPVGFKIKTALMPEVTLPDYKALAKTVMATEDKIAITDDEFTKALEDFRRRHAQSQGKKPEETPELTDDLVKTFGEFKDVPDFKTKFKEALVHEKESRAREKKRVEVSDKIIEGSTIALPRVLIDSELDKMIGQLKSDLDRMKLPFENYLGQIKKTEADLRKEWEEGATKRAKLQLILNKIAEVEGIKANPMLVENELKHLLEHIKDADPERTRLYIESMLKNEEVFKFLESQK